MMIKNLGGQVASVWDGLRPITKKMLVGVLRSGGTSPTNKPQKFSYDAHSDWELSRLLSVLDEQSKTDEIRKDNGKLTEISLLAETCVRVLETRTGSAEVFIQLAERILKQQDYNKLDKLADTLQARFSCAEIAEIIRQTELAQIRAIAYETLALLPLSSLTPLLDDPLYADISICALEQKAYEFGSDEARLVLEKFDMEMDVRRE